MNETTCGFGIVFEVDDHLLESLETSLNFLQRYLEDTMITYPNEDQEWVEEPHTAQLESIISKLEHRESYVEAVWDVLETPLPVRLTLSNEHEAFLLHLAIDTASLPKDTASVIEVSEFFESVMHHLDAIVAHEYIFFDLMADYLYSPTRITEIDYVPYALLKQKDTAFQQAAWYWDKQTLRDA